MAQATSFPDPPLRSPFLNKDGAINFAWVQWLQAITSQFIAPIVVRGAIASNAPGQPGQQATDGNFLYVCTAVNSWKRIALTAF